MSYSKYVTGLIIALGFILLVLPACLDNPLISIEDDPLPDTVKIKIGHISYFPEKSLSIRFVDVLNDCRCPLNLECFWEGDAEISLGVQIKPNPEVIVPLKIFGYVNIENSTRHVWADTLGYHISLLALNPYPVAYDEYDFENYSATISIYEQMENK